MIDKPYLVRVREDTIVNLENVTVIRRTEQKLFISLIGELKAVVILEGDEAQAMWIYFSSALMSYCPLTIKNPGQKTLD